MLMKDFVGQLVVAVAAVLGTTLTVWSLVNYYLQIKGIKWLNW